MAGTLGDMKSRIASELGRGSALDTQIANAITDAITAYQSERFKFSDVDPAAPPTFDTVIGQWVYSSADNANIGTQQRIDYVDITIGNTLQALVREQPNVVRLYNQTNTMSGQPMWFAYEGQKLLIAPIPSQVWTVTLGLFQNVAAPASDGETGNPWMTDAEMLIRSRAKYELALHVTRNEAMKQAMSPDPPAENGGVKGAAWREYRRLKAVGARSTARGMVRPTRF